MTSVAAKSTICSKEVCLQTKTSNPSNKWIVWFPYLHIDWYGLYHNHIKLHTGAYGVVCSAINRKTRQKVAIKKIPNIYTMDPRYAIRTYREIKILQVRECGEYNTFWDVVLLWVESSTYILIPWICCHYFVLQTLCRIAWDELSADCPLVHCYQDDLVKWCLVYLPNSWNTSLQSPVTTLSYPSVGHIFLSILFDRVTVVHTFLFFAAL